MLKFYVYFMLALVATPLASLGGKEIEVQGGFYVEQYTSKPWLQKPFKLSAELTLLAPFAPEHRTVERSHFFGQAAELAAGGKLLLQNVESSLLATASDKNRWQFIDQYCYRQDAAPLPELSDIFSDLFSDPSMIDLKDTFAATFAGHSGIFYEADLTIQPGYRLCGFCFYYQNRLLHFKFVFSADLPAKTNVSYQKFMQAFVEQVYFIKGAL
ncbi:MAG: hypothetical protein K0S07_1098 [Chlamydiales bacterium]|nr:hypothetical protein [Chlamydiales bacterium]